MSLATHVVRRGAVYYFRARVPGSLVAVVGRREISRSLRTSDPGEARRLQAMVGRLTERLWAALQRTMSPEEISVLVEGWLLARLNDDQAVREGLDSSGKVASLMAELQDARDRFADRDHTISDRHVDELAASAGLQLTDRERELANRFMLRAHVRLLRAIERRTAYDWVPHMMTDPGLPSIDHPLSDAATNPLGLKTHNGVEPVGLSPPGQQRAGIKLQAAADEAIREIARLEGVRPGRSRDYEVAVRTFIDWHGRDPDLAAITPEIAGRFKLDLTYYPSNASKRAPYRDLKTFGERLDTAKKASELNVLNSVTINNKYLTPLRRIFEWQRANGRRVENPFREVHAALPKHPDSNKHVNRRPILTQDRRRRLTHPSQAFAVARRRSAEPLAERSA